MYVYVYTHTYIFKILKNIILIGLKLFLKYLLSFNIKNSYWCMDNFLTVDCRERLNQLNDLICVFRPSICGFSVTFFKIKKKNYTK
jgi:hypothetical protein